MRELIAKIGRLCENHVEKIVLVIAGIISAWLFITGVVISPDVVKYDNKNVAVSRVDEQVAQKLDKLRGNMDRVTNRTDETPYVPRLTGPVEPNDPVMAVLGDRPEPKSFESLFHSPLAYLATAPASGQPTVHPADTGLARYRLPAIPRLIDVTAGYLRAAAYVPQAQVTLDHPYSAVQSQVDDVDLVTVEAKFNIADTFKLFQAYFNGSEVPREDWRDPCLAVPKFAAVQLERQEILDTGFWSDWTTVPPNRTCPYSQLFRIIDNVKDLPVGGIGMRMANYDSILITMALLQPDSYSIASADEQWYPPSYYDRFKRIQRQIEARERQKERDDARNQANNAAAAATPTGRRGDTMRGGATGLQGGRGTMGGRGGQTGGDMYGGGYGGRGGRGGMTGRGGAITPHLQGRAGATRGTGRGTRGATDPYQQGYGYGYDPMNPAAQGPSVAEVELDFLKNKIIPTTNLASLKEPLLIWRIDDTVRPGKTYRYRMRVGVFNPVAGTGHVAERDAARKDQVILWSDFTPATTPVAIYKKVYFFAKDVQERTNTASIEVARYLRGYWRTDDFQVQPGETIGKEVETKKDRRQTRAAADATGRITGAGVRGDTMDLTLMNAGNMGLGLGAGQEVDEMNPPTIDFSTNALLVDLVPVADWTGAPNVHSRSYFDVLYTEDGTRIEHMPAMSRGWSRALADAYQEIKTNALKDKKALRTFSNRGTGMEGGRYSPYGGGGGGGGYPY
jgi:hypothetical protein